MNWLRRSTFALLATLLPLSAASAQSAPEAPRVDTPPAQTQPAEDRAPWPEALRHRNSRYAHLGRDFDREGDRRERRLADAVLERERDELGDREVARRARAAAHVPPRATLLARVDRDRDLEGDHHEAILAARPTARLYADIRRTRDRSGDNLELASYRDYRLNYGPLAPSPLAFARETRDLNRLEFLDYREELLRLIQGNSLRDFERDLSDLDDDEIDVLLRGRDPGDTIFDTHEDSADAAFEDAEAEADAELEASEANLEADLERSIDETEAQLERDLDRQVEQQLQQDELTSPDP